MGDRRARGVLHELPRDSRVGERHGLAGLERLEASEARDVPHREARLLGKCGLVRRAPAGRGEALVGEERPGPRVAEQMGDLARREVRVDGRVVPARLHHREDHLDEGRAVREHARHDVAGAQAPGAEPVHDPVRGGGELAGGVRASVGLDQGKPRRAVARRHPEAGERHGSQRSSREGSYPPTRTLSSSTAIRSSPRLEPA